MILQQFIQTQTATHTFSKTANIDKPNRLARIVLISVVAIDFTYNRHFITSTKDVV